MMNDLLRVPEFTPIAEPYQYPSPAVTPLVLASWVVASILTNLQQGKKFLINMS
jgi:hypothetical protein